MKKVYLSLLVVAALSTSCKKNYTCSCVTTTVGSTGTGNTTETITARSSTDALNQCNADVQSNVGAGGTFNCKIQ